LGEFLAPVATLVLGCAPARIIDDGGAGTGNTDDGGNSCGNGMIDAGEECDGNDLGREDCLSLGYDEGSLSCTGSCTLDTAACITWACGNDVKERTEECDGTDLDGQSCTDHSFYAGTLGCDAECAYDTTGCHNCGNGTIDIGEACETGDLAGETCMSQGYVGGTLACGTDCNFDTTACITDDYTEDFESGSLGPEWTTSGNANWTVSTTSPIAGSYSAHSGDIDDGEHTDLLLTLEFNAAGDISFRHKESTEGCCDDLVFYIDNVQQGSWAGSNGAMTATYPVAAGTRTFKWIYDKDLSVSSGSDTVWIDDIHATGGRVP